MDDDGARERDALLLAARQTLRQAVLILRNLHDVENLVDFLLHLTLRDLAELQAVLDILTHRQMRENRIALEHHADVALVRRDVVDDLVVEADLAALDGVESGNHAQERRLSTARRPQERKKFAVLDMLREPRDDRQVSIALDDVLDFDGNTHVSHLFQKISISIV